MGGTGGPLPFSQHASLPATHWSEPRFFILLKNKSNMSTFLSTSLVDLSYDTIVQQFDTSYDTAVRQTDTLYDTVVRQFNTSTKLTYDMLKNAYYGVDT